MRWRYLILLAIMALGFLGQHTRLRQLEAQLAVLTDCSQRQELQLKQMDTQLAAINEAPQEAAQPLTELVKKYAGYFDDHDVSGLLEDD